MARQDWLEYFDLLTRLGNTLGELGEVQEEKTEAVVRGELPKIDEIMKREQAFALTLRGYEQKRVTTLKALQVPVGPLSQLLEVVPADLQEQGKVVVKFLQDSYAYYREASDETKTVLEDHLQHLEILTGVESGYAPQKQAQERSLEDNPMGGPVQQPGNVRLNLQSLQNAANAQLGVTGTNAPPKVHPVSQSQLTATAQEMEELHNKASAAPSQNDLRKMAQQMPSAGAQQLRRKTEQSEATVQGHESKNFRV